MAKIPRENLKVFGGTGPDADFAKFGSLAAAAPVETKNVATIQSLSRWDVGLRDCLLTAKAPPLQDFNSVLFVHSRMQAYMFQEGIAEWLTDTNYFIGSVVKRTGTFELYGSIVDNNAGNALPNQIDDANWRYLGRLSNAPSKYRRPRLIWVSGTTVDLEGAIVTGTAGDVSVVYPDGEYRMTNSATLTRLDMSRTAILTGSKRSGLDTGTVTADRWYFCYAVKSQDSLDNIHVASLLEPTAANLATLNARFGVNGWRYLGAIRNGDDSVVTSILEFVMDGDTTQFTNVFAFGGGRALTGMNLAQALTNTVATWAYAVGGGAAQIPSILSEALVSACVNVGSAGNGTLSDSAVTRYYGEGYSGTNWVTRVWAPATGGFKATGPGGSNLTIVLAGFKDRLLGAPESYL